MDSICGAGVAKKKISFKVVLTRGVDVNKRTVTAHFYS